MHALLFSCVPIKERKRERGDMSSKPSDENGVQFNTEMDPEAELQEMQRQVSDLQEDLRLKTLQETAAQDEGHRKSTGFVATKNASIFVGGLDPRTTEGELRVFFSSCGTIKRLTMLRDKFTGQLKGNAYIEFEAPEQAAAGILKDGQSLHGKPLNVAMKRDNIPAFQRGRGSSGFSRGGYRGGGPGAMQQQMAMAATMMAASMMGGAGGGFNPFGGMARGRGRGRGRGGVH
ncbi:RNA-binding protein, putative [Trypanosoma cruzi]|uniref:RNA-binding protein n=2 Tax=Trypanosoma cruzi TaxID=5693 RepID=V5B7C6_TRYCR|nr:RNA-binding protein, putative [Trypanosoma cruzi]ESS69150.1 RNA-binding protein [Trypanosoma cruzi Dm28c]KAF8286034.1 putative RNA-binding protein [Trypanosoma cruzi]